MNDSFISIMILQHLTLTIKSVLHSVCNLQTRNMSSLSLIVIITILSQASSSQTNGLTCPEGWEALYGKCYLIVTRQSGSGLSWSLAQQDCHANGGKLALPLDKTENDGIFDLYSKKESKNIRFWIDAVALDHIVTTLQFLSENSTCFEVKIDLFFLFFTILTDDFDL